MQQFNKWNKGYRYLLMVLDVFSKYGWIVPLKDKKGETVTEAFKTILKEGRKPQYLWVDKGKEYHNKHVKELLDKNKITLYSTENEEKSSVCERWNRTIKSKMWKQFKVILVSRFCKPVDIKLVFSTFKIKNLFNVKDPLPDRLRTRVVYKFSCSSCNACYIGETSRHFATRVREHLSSDRSSHVFKHLQSSESCRISCSVDCFTVLDSATTKFQVKLKESMYIIWEKPDLNQQVKHASVVYDQVHAHSTLPWKLLNCMHRDVMYRVVTRYFFFPTDPRFWP